MPETTTLKRARADLRAGKSPSTAAGEFVREEMEHIRRGKHGARSPDQAIAIGPSKQTGKRTRKAAKRDYEVARERARRS